MPRKIKAPNFIGFMVSPAGRGMRIVLGAAMIIFGFLQMSVLGALVCALGFFPLMTGAFDICLLGPLFGGFFSGDKTRITLHVQQGQIDLGTHSRSWLRA